MQKHFAKEAALKHHIADRTVTKIRDSFDGENVSPGMNLSAKDGRSPFPSNTRAPLPIDVFKSRTCDEQRREHHLITAPRMVPSKFRRSVEMLDDGAVERMIADAQATIAAREAYRMEKRLISRLDVKDIPEAEMETQQDSGEVYEPKQPKWDEMTPEQLLQQYVLAPSAATEMVNIQKKRAAALNKRRRDKAKRTAQHRFAVPMARTASQIARDRPRHHLDQPRYERTVIKALNAGKPTAFTVF